MSDAGGVFEHLALQMRGGSIAEGREAVLARRRPGRLDELGQRLGRHLGAEHQALCCDADLRDGIEAFLWVVGQVREEGRVHRHPVDHTVRDGVAISRLPRRVLQSDHTAGVRLVVDDDRLAELLADLFGQVAGHQIRLAARRR
jgi:hypothetical protein